MQDKLTKVLTFYGKDDTANHVTVVEDSNRWAGKTSTIGGETTVHIGSAGGIGATAGVVAHEGWHGVDETQRWHGRNPSSTAVNEEFDSEVRAYTLQSAVNRTTNTWTRVYEPGDNADEIEDKIYKAALDSTRTAVGQGMFNSKASQEYMGAHSTPPW